MTGTVELIQRIRYAEIPDEKGEMQVCAIPEVENIRELVRCKDCKYFNDYFVECEKNNHTHGAAWFCADAERKEGSVK